MNSNNNFNNNVVPEDQTRARFLTIAREYGVEMQLRQIFDKYDKLLLYCKNEKERKDIAIMGAAEVYRMFGWQDGLSVDNKIIIPADKDFKPVLQGKEWQEVEKK